MRLDHHSQRVSGIRHQSVGVAFDFAGYFSLPGDALRTANTGPAVFKVVFEEESEVEEGCISRRLAPVQEGWILHTNQRGKGFGGAELLERSFHACRDFGERRRA